MSLFEKKVPETFGDKDICCTFANAFTSKLEF